MMEERQRQRNLCPRDRVWINDAQRTCCRAGLLCLCMFPPSAVGTSEITITIHHGPVRHQMRARLDGRTREPACPRYEPTYTNV